MQNLSKTEKQLIENMERRRHLGSYTIEYGTDWGKTGRRRRGISFGQREIAAARKLVQKGLIEFVPNSLSKSHDTYRGFRTHETSCIRVRFTNN